MKMHKKLLSLLLVLCLLFSLSVVAYAAIGGFTMTYLPGTSDTVTDMPPADSGTGGQPYTVSDMIPQREGYEFLGWELDYSVVNTYTLTYQVTGDPTYGVPGDTATPGPVTGIREGGSVTLADALTTEWETSNGDPAPTAATYVIRCLDASNEEDIVDPVVKSGTVGSVVTEDAPYISRYVTMDPYSITRTLKPNAEGKWTFTGWCSDEACTTPITEVTDITADTTVYSKWVYSETTNINEITFYYEKEPQYTSYLVRYVDRTTGADIAEPKVVKDQKVGDTAEETAVESDNYDLDDDGIKSLPLQAENNEIIFYYKPAIANYIVRYVDVTYGDFVDIIEPEIGTGNVGSKITKSYNRTFSDYCFIGSKTRISIILTRNDENNVIIFEYTRLM